MKIQIIKINATDLRNVELLGKNDPYVELTIGGKTCKTVVIDDAGANAEWILPNNTEDFLFDVPDDGLQTTEMDIVVMEKNTARSDILIGKSSTPLIALAGVGDQEVTIKVKLTNDQKATGSVEIVLRRVIEISSIQINNGLAEENLSQV